MGKSASITFAEIPSPSKVTIWFSWILGIAALSGVILAAQHFSDELAIVELLKKTRLSWLTGAIIIQASTYLLYGQVWRIVFRSASSTLSIRTAYRLSLVKLFIDQALPSGGLSGTFVIGEALEQRGYSRRAIISGAAVNTASFYFAFGIGFLSAVALAVANRRVEIMIVLAGVLFLVLAIGFSVFLLFIPGHKSTLLQNRFLRFPITKQLVQLLQQADPLLARNSQLLVRGTVLQFGIVLLDTMTIWFLLRSLGVTTRYSDVFSSFMISTLLRTVGVVPGGLGAFEAASIMTLRSVGIPVPEALSATLLFRALSFWIPMFPGAFFARAFLGHKSRHGERHASR